MKTSPKKLKILERQHRALDLRRSGKSYRAIAQTISTEFGLPGYGCSQAYNDVSALLQQSIELTREQAFELVQLELDRLDVAVDAIADRVKEGDLRAIDRWIKISERRSKLLGLDAPFQLQVADQVEAELSGFLAQLESLLDRETFLKVLRIHSNSSHPELN